MYTLCYHSSPHLLAKQRKRAPLSPMILVRPSFYSPRGVNPGPAADNQFAFRKYLYASFEMDES